MIADIFNLKYTPDQFKSDDFKVLKEGEKDNRITVTLSMTDCHEINHEHIDDTFAACADLITQKTGIKHLRWRGMNIRWEDDAIDFEFEIV